MYFKSDAAILDQLNLLKINSKHFLATSRNDTSAIKSNFQKMDRIHSVANYL